MPFGKWGFQHEDITVLLLYSNKIKVSSVHAIFSMLERIYFYIYKTKQALRGCQLPPEDIKMPVPRKNKLKTQSCEK